MENAEIIKALPEEWDLSLSPKEDLVAALVEKIGQLIAGDMNKLISLLYRMDVSEQKIKTTLQAQPQEDAARLIAALVIERQAQRIKSRQESSTKRNDDADW